MPSRSAQPVSSRVDVVEWLRTRTYSPLRLALSSPSASHCAWMLTGTVCCGPLPHTVDRHIGPVRVAAARATRAW